ncbi:Tautomerase/MIF superfamily [Vararia minispora EC-137]|uniref:Tautomerase/MIF superfamily n=1 Tax=Vararia minispora EC-137 TaxID=1314806 RepID=A0ACB8QVE9_9AGAM|nr:Tautomerase/MIF superfamily [Vararia minispora EC-137]
MPTLCVTSNVKPGDLKAFNLELSQLAAKTFNKVERIILVSFDYQPHMSFAGTFEPAFLLAINSVGNMTPENNIVYSKIFFDFFGRTLGAPDDRGYMFVLSITCVGLS